MGIKLFNTKKIIACPEIGKYGFSDSLFSDDLSSAKELSIVSAFYDELFFEWLLEKINKNVKLRVFLPIEKSLKKRKKQKNLLDGLSKESIRYKFNIIDSGYLLHSKIYMIKKKTNRRVCWIGSSNSSSNSLMNCEEAMIRLTDPECMDRINDYFSELETIGIDSSQYISKIETKSVFDFINQGNLFSRISRSFSPSMQVDFGEYEEKIMKAIRNQTHEYATLILRTTNKIPLFDLIKRNIVASGGTDKEVNRLDLTKLRGQAPAITQYGLLTSLGYWVPNAYMEQVQRLINKSDYTKKRKAVFKHLYSYLDRLRKNNFENPDMVQLLNFYKSILEYFAELAKADLNPDHFYATPNNHNIKSLKNQITSTAEKLQPDSVYYEIIINPYRFSSVPNIWNDAISTNEFFESYYESLIYEHLKKKTKNKIYHSICNFNENSMEGDGLITEPIDSLENIIRKKTKTINKLMAQYNFIKFGPFNKDQYNFTFEPLAKTSTSHMKIGTEVYWREDDGSFTMGKIKKINRKGKNIAIVCDWENQNDPDEYQISNDCLYSTEFK